MLKAATRVILKQLGGEGYQMSSVPSIRTRFESKGVTVDVELRHSKRPKKRVPGSNDVGMLAWKLALKTPEYPEGLGGIAAC